MSLANGSKLGSYEILSPLGAGGMGEVYLANDFKLDRRVAIKVLPESMTRDPERVARFEREAKVLASLNHPNIAAIHGFDDADQTRFLVMEYVEGETLAQRLKGGAFAVEDAMDIAKQMAEALEAAHEKGVIHRDLKPGNVMIRPDGTVKVLDFGLAKAMAEEPTDSVPTDSPTITANFTRPGVVLGTAAYMSPEQARGRPLDKRTDIWSFGIMLFECLTGQRLFQGETANDSMGAIMHKDPDWSLLPQNTPPTIQLLLQRCLAKDRKRRLHDIADARIELENALVDPTSTSLGLARAALDVHRRWLPSWPGSMAIILVVALAGVGGWFARSQPKVSSPVLRLSAVVSEDVKLGINRNPFMSISPDGRQLAYVATAAEGRRQLYLHRMHLADATPLPNTNGAAQPIFSADGKWIAFWQQGKLKRISVLGGPALTICDAANIRGADWGADKTIAYAPTRRSGIYHVPAAGGKPEQLTDLGPNPGAASHRWPHFLPDGQAVLFTNTDNEDDYSAARIEAVFLDTRERKVLIEGATDARYVPTGHLVFARGDVLMAVAFDPRNVEITGSEIPVLEGLTTSRATGSGHYSFSDNGVLVYLPGGRTSRLSELVWVDRTGQATVVSHHARDAIGQALSPDGTRIAWVIGGGDAGIPDVWVLEIARDMLNRLTFDDGVDQNPLWSPDGSWIYFQSDRVHGVSEIYRRKADGSGEAERLTTAKNPQHPESMSPDGKTVVFIGYPTGIRADIMLLHLDEERRVEPFLTSPFRENDPAVSPDGKFIAYTSRETGIDAVYVRQFPSGTGRIKISPSVGWLPKWSPDGTELFYTDGKGKFYSVAIDTKDDVLIPSSPHLMFKLPDDQYSPLFNVAPDGQRFLFSRLQDGQLGEPRHPTVVVNWFAELRQKMAAVAQR